MNKQSINRQKLAVYIMCRDRPEYALQAIKTVVASLGSIAGVNIIVSDNSTSDRIFTNIKNIQKSFDYIRRFPPMDVIAHHKKIISECSAEYLVMFHDDDVMSTNYIEVMLNTIEQFPTIGAVACNARLINETNAFYGNNFFRQTQAIKFIENEKKLIESYGAFAKSSHPPFPSYLYRCSFIHQDMINNSMGGKHADVSFLCNIIKKSSGFIWLNQVLLDYRWHSGNGSVGESICDRISLTRYLISNRIIERKSIDLQRIRFGYWWPWAKSQLKKQKRVILWRNLVVIKFLILTIFLLAFGGPKYWKLLACSFVKKSEILFTTKKD
jgi:Glycosyl transferase family 2